MTPGPVSSASGYANARQRTTSAAGQYPPSSQHQHQRAPSVPPVPTHQYQYQPQQQPFVVSSAMRGKSKEVVDDRDRDDGEEHQQQQQQQVPSRPVAPSMGMGRISSLKARISATNGMGSRTSSNRSALVEEDAPPPAESVSVSVSRVYSSRPDPEDDDDEDDEDDEEDEEEEEEEEAPVIPSRDKGKGKAVDVDPPVEHLALPRNNKNMMFGSVLDRYAMQLRADLQISA